MKASATSSAVLVLRATSSVYLVKASLKTNMYWWPVRESFFRGPKISIWILEYGSTGMGYSSIFARGDFFLLFLNKTCTCPRILWSVYLFLGKCTFLLCNFPVFVDLDDQLGMNCA